jgi:hypothetical protein
MKDSLIVCFEKGLTLLFSDSDNVNGLQTWFQFNNESKTINIVENDNEYIINREKICYMVLCAR